jgi:hypothetical protein
MRGDLVKAFEEGMRAVADDPAGINTPLASWDAAQAAIWSRDAVKVRSARAAMAPLRGRWIETARRTVDAGIAALEGRTEDALALYRESSDAWLAMDLPMDHAYCAIDAALLLPPDGVPETDVRRAREYLERLGAKPMMDRLETARQPAAAEAP